MKKINLMLLLAGLYSSSSFSQQNVFPNNGNVGIGTTSPSVKLDVNGSLRVNEGTEFGGSVKMLNIPLLNEPTGLGNNNGQGNSNGLGNNNPYKFLVIGEDGVIYARRAGVGENHVPGRLCGESPLQDVLNPQWGSGLNKLYAACPQVNVGIGTETPRVKLDVQGKTYIFQQAIGNLDPTVLYRHLLYGKSYAYHDPNDKIVLFESSYGNELLSLQNSGTLTTRDIVNHGRYELITGQANINSNYVFSIKNNERYILRLNNNGLLRAREIKVDTELWPDFVFAPDYQLMELKEVENYISNHKHLPNIPSAKEIETDGINLGEMVKQQMQKIEELYLHAIEQSKIIEAQEKRIEKLESQIKSSGK